MLLGDVREGRRHTIPVLDSVSARLSERYRAVNARYFLTVSNLGRADPIQPLIVADTPNGRVIVNSDLEVFEEVGFERDPPGLSESAMVERRSNQSKTGSYLVKKDGVVRFRRAGTINAERR